MARAYPKRPYRKPAAQIEAPVVPRAPREKSYQPFRFKCVACDADGHYGFGVKLREGRVGFWACLNQEHIDEAKRQWQANFHLR